MGAIRPLLIGEAPGRDPIPTPRLDLSLTGSSGRSLARLAGVSWVTYLRRTRRRNLFYEPQPRWDARRARDVAESMRLEVGTPVILLGARVASAFGVHDWPFFEWRPLRAGVVAARAPHPSGRNRLLNRADVRRRYRAFLREAMLGDS